MELPIHGALLLLLLIFLLSSQTFTSAQPVDGSSSDRSALLSFKSMIDEDPYGALLSWNQSTPLCKWRGVTCNATMNPGRVISLELESLSLSGLLSPSLSNLTFLTKLHLPNNTLRGAIPSELGGLRRLINLNLSMNTLDGIIPPSLGGCEQLQGLSLRSNLLHGTIPANVSRCSKLQILSLRTNRLQGGIPPELGKLPALVNLYLQSNNLTGVIPTELGNLTSLTELRLQYNNLGGSIPWQLSKIKGLQVLDLLFNQFTGNVPPLLCNFSELYGFGMGGNLLNGTLPPDFGLYLPKLKYVLLYNNDLEGSIPNSIANASVLESLQLSNNSFSGVVPPNLGMISTLKDLQLGGNKLVAKNAKDWTFMESLTNCSNLELLDLADNELAGSLPRSVANLSTSIVYLRMKNNNISGEITPEITKLVNLEVLGMDSNLLTGTIPDTIGRLSGLRVLSLYNNSLSGTIPESIGNITSLIELYLSLNHLTGSIPPSFEKLQMLNAMDLSYNKLSGVIPKGLLTISSFTGFLNISDNNLSGRLPVEVGSLKNLKALDVSDNNLNGEIPSSIGQCQQLDYLHLGGNLFQESIPQSMSNLKELQMLNLSHNNLSGPIPSFLAKLPLTYLNLSFNNFEGEVPKEGVFANGSLISLVGNPRLCGGIPDLHLNSCNSSKRGHGHTALIVGLIVGAAVLIMMLLVCFFMRSLVVKKEEQIVPKTSFKLWHSGVSYGDLHKATDGFSSENLIGTGSYGSVYKGSLKQYKNMVAIKVLNCERKGALSGFMAECKILRSIRHRNLVRVLTACSTADRNGHEFKALVYEYMPNGSLHSWLHEDHGHLDLFKRIGIVNDVALALDYLHHDGETPVVHSDLKPSNILLDIDMTAHVGDFGLARFLNKNASMATSTNTVAVKGTIGYIAPEYGMGSPISTHGDMYSFGILILEMLTGKRPTDEGLEENMNLHKYVDRSYPDSIRDIMDPRLLEEGDGRISKEDAYECMVSMFGIGLACSREVPNERMDSKNVLKQLAAVKDMFREEDKVHNIQGK